MDRKLRQTGNDSRALPTCPYEKAILDRTCACPHAGRSKAGSRYMVRCAFEDGNVACVKVLSCFRKMTNFAFGAPGTPSALTRAQALRLQCGGLLGLQNALDKVVHNHRVDDICALVRRALKRYGSVERFPGQDIVRGIASFDKRGS